MLQIVGWVGEGGGQIVIPMPEALSFAESRRQKIEYAMVSHTCVLLKPNIIKVWQRSQKWNNGIIQQPTKIIIIIKYLVCSLK
jgi:hypothetical protein